MAPPNTNGSTHNEDIRRYVMQRDTMCCQWPGCGNTLNIDVLFLVETETEQGSTTPLYKNGISLCPKHMEMVNLHDKTFAPLVFDLIQLVEFENDLQETERVYKQILQK